MMIKKNLTSNFSIENLIKFRNFFFFTLKYLKISIKKKKHKKI